MPEQVTLPAERRTIHGKRVRQLRRQGILPANIFGPGRPSRAIQVNAHELNRLLQTHSNTTLIQLQLGAERENVLVSHVQHRPATGAIQHVDFIHVEMRQPIRARVPLHFLGEAPAVRTEDGVLLHPIESIEVEALPRQLPDAIDVDLSVLTEIGANITIADLKIPANVQVLSDPETTVATITPPRVTPIEGAAEILETAAEAPAAPEGEAESQRENETESE